MPLTEKGEKILASMKSQYGPEKGEQVFYASKNAGKITGVDRADDNQHMGFTSGLAEPVKKLTDGCDALSARIDAFEHRKAQRQPISVKPKKKDNMQPSNVHPKEPGGE